MAGKDDWLAFGLPYEGEARFVGAVADPQVPTCSFQATLREVRSQLEASRHGLVVVNERDVVLGRLGHDALKADDGDPVERLMREGPGTIRPNAELEQIVDRMRRRDIPTLVVTRLDGTLMGILERERAEQAAEAS